MSSLIDEYKSFLNEGKTERECVRVIEAEAVKNGYKNICDVEKLLPGDKVYVSKFGKAVALFEIGTSRIENGMNILGAHIDSPRLDVKQNPVYEKDFIVYMNTHYYGGIKKYQWLTMPLAIHGVVCKKNGSVVNICVGEKSDDPVFCISDILPLLALLKETYGIEEKDLSSAELEVVPAGESRDLGFDRSLVLGYGQDDRSCAFTSVKAMFETRASVRTNCCVCVDKEEIGSVGATGMGSHFLENAVAEVIARLENYSDLTLRRCLNSSSMLSSDVNSAFDPLNADLYDRENASFLGGGIVFNKYTGARGKSGASDASPEFIARLRNVLDRDGVKYQMAELGKVDQGGGGTIAYLAAKYGMYVLDAGVAVLSMHAPWEITSRSDIEQAFAAYRSFLTLE